MERSFFITGRKRPGLKTPKRLRREFAPTAREENNDSSLVRQCTQSVHSDSADNDSADNDSADMSSSRSKTTFKTLPNQGAGDMVTRAGRRRFFRDRAGGRRFFRAARGDACFFVTTRAAGWRFFRDHPFFRDTSGCSFFFVTASAGFFLTSLFP